MNKKNKTKGEKMNNFQNELEALINKYSMENESDTPDFILAKYLAGCLKTFDDAIKARDGWYGVDLFPGCDIAEKE